MSSGGCYVSVFGFLFLQTRIFGIALPFHRDFKEVNLRFYVRQRGLEGCRRGVVFVKELVPRRAIDFLARTIYGEPYSAVPMAHEISARDGQTSLHYEWERSGRAEFVAAQTTGEPAFVRPGALEEFITSTTGTTSADRGRSTQYQVEHPSWHVWRAANPQFDADVRTLYGAGFIASPRRRARLRLRRRGSGVIVRRGTRVLSG